MSKQKIIYISRKMTGYRSASYQQEVMDELARQAQVHFYGPGFSEYDVNDSINDVLVKVPFDPDFVILGHAWLNDMDGSEVDPHPKLQLAKTEIPKIAILNKEYTNLSAKLNYLKKNQFDMGFTHHHDVGRYTQNTGINFIFWPFAFQKEKFDRVIDKKTIDVSFSGILQNLNRNSLQSDIRARIMRSFFISMFDIPFIKRKPYKQIEILWNSKARNKIGRNISRLLKKQQYYNMDDYVKMMQRTKIYINTLSPMGLISPRFFECMASKSLVFCERSPLYANIFPDDLYITFDNDLSNFKENLFSILSDRSMRHQITDKAYKYVYAKHTWEKRVTSLLNDISFNS